MSIDYFVHSSSCIDDGAVVGKGTKIWHFCHIQSGDVIGEFCSLGQNVNIASNVKIGNGVKIQNNVSVYEGVSWRTMFSAARPACLQTIFRPGQNILKNGQSIKNTC